MFQACLQRFPKTHFWNITVSFSRMPLKEMFLETLKTIENNNRTQEFCGILLDAKEVIQKSQSISRHRYSLHPSAAISMDKDELDTHLIIYKLKDMIHDRHKYVLVDMILNAVCEPNYDRWDEARQHLISLFLKIDTFKFLNSKHQIPREFLQNLVNDIECFINNIIEDVPFHISKSKGTLKMLQCRLFNCIKRDLLTLTFEINDADHNFSEVETKEFKTLVNDAVSPIITQLSYLNTASKSVFENSVLSRKSSHDSNEDEASLEKFYEQEIYWRYRILDEVSIHHMTLKERLLVYLKNIKSSYNTYVFLKTIEFLSKFKRKRSVMPFNTDSLNTDLFINKLKHIIRSEKPEFNIVNNILNALHIRTDHLNKANELISLFSDFDNYDFLNPKYQNSEMYSIQELERIVYIYDGGDRYRENVLSALCSELHTNLIVDTQILLKTILKVNLSKMHFSDEEKRKFGPLMVEAIKPISMYVSSPIHYWPSKNYVLNQRSEIQFFKEFLDAFQAVDETPLNIFDIDKINRCIDILDEDLAWIFDELRALAKYKDQPDGELNPFDLPLDGCFYDDEEDTALVEAGASEMPYSHTWWAKCFEILNKPKNLKISYGKVIYL